MKFLEVGVDAVPELLCEDHLHRHISIHLHLLFLAGYRHFGLVVGKVKEAIDWCRGTGGDKLALIEDFVFDGILHSGFATSESYLGWRYKRVRGINTACFLTIHSSGKDRALVM